MIFNETQLHPQVQHRKEMTKIYCSPKMQNETQGKTSEEKWTRNDQFDPPRLSTKYTFLAPGALHAQHHHNEKKLWWTNLYLQRNTIASPSAGSRIKDQKTFTATTPNHGKRIIENAGMGRSGLKWKVFRQTTGSRSSYLNTIPCHANFQSDSIFLCSSGLHRVHSH